MWTPSWLLVLSFILTRAITYAQDLSSIPQCGQNCFNVAFNEFGRSCPTRDATCLCSQPGFDPEISSCTSQQCVTATDSNSTLAFLQTFCGPVFQGPTSATIVVPTVTSTGPSGAPSNATVTQPFPMTNATMSMSSMAATSTVVIDTSSAQSAASTTGGTGSMMSSATGTASASVASSINAGDRIGSDRALVPSMIIFSVLSFLFSS